MNATPLGVPGRDRPLRVCHLGKFYPPAPGGIESHVQALARAQADLGAEVEVLCVNHASDTGEDVSWTHLGRSSDEVGWDDKVLVQRVGRIAGFGRYELCPSLRRRLREVADRVDILHVHAPNATMYLALLGQRLEGKLVVTHHSDIIKHPSLAKAYRPLEAHTLARAELVLSTSAAYLEGSLALQAVSEKVRPLPMGLALTPYLSPSPIAEAFAAELIRQHGRPLWLAVGRLVPYKGFEVAVEALHGVPGKLLVVGEGPLAASLERLARARGVSERVGWLKRLEPEQLVGAYHAATALWFPSVERSEGFGLVQVEAMASGCPVLNTFVPGSAVAWVSQDGVSGLTVPRRDAAALARAAVALHSDEPLRQHLAAGARRRAIAEFSAELMGHRSLSLYAEAAGLTPAPR